MAKAAEVIITKDVDLALQLETDDDEMDLLHRTLFQHLMDDRWKHGIETAVDVTLLGRYYERFADHAVSVAKRVVYLVTGEHADEIRRLRRRSRGRERRACASAPLMRPAGLGGRWARAHVNAHRLVALSGDSHGRFPRRQPPAAGPRHNPPPARTRPLRLRLPVGRAVAVRRLSLSAPCRVAVRRTVRQPVHRKDSVHQRCC